MPLVGLDWDPSRTQGGTSDCLSLASALFCLPGERVSPGAWKTAVQLVFWVWCGALTHIPSLEQRAGVTQMGSSTGWGWSGVRLVCRAGERHPAALLGWPHSPASQVLGP